MPRERTPRPAPVALPGEVLRALDQAGESISERAAPEGETRTVVQFTGQPALLVEDMAPTLLQRIFPELTGPGQPEAALQHLRRVVRDHKRAMRRLRRPNWVTSWRDGL